MRSHFEWARTYIVVKHGGHILGGELVGGVGDEKTGLIRSAREWVTLGRTLPTAPSPTTTHLMVCMAEGKEGKINIQPLGGIYSASLFMDPTATTLQRLKQRRLESASANRKDLIAETNLVRQSNSNQAKLERKRKQLEDLAQKEDAAITGEDLERKRNWDYSIEDNENWDKKLALKGRRADFSFTGTSSSPSGTG